MEMTIEEAIKHCEEVAEEQRRLFSLCPAPSDMCDPYKDCAALTTGKNRGCLKCAKEHEQLGEWLRELKSLKEKDERKKCRDIEEIAEAINCDADAEAKCKMISNILTAKPHYFEEQKSVIDKIKGEIKR